MLLAAIVAFHFYLIFNAKLEKHEYDSCEFRLNSSLPESFFALFGDFEELTFNDI